MKTTVHIKSINGNLHNYRYYLEYIKENNKSIYCESNLYGDVYRIEKKTGKVFCNNKQIAETCEYSCF